VDLNPYVDACMFFHLVFAVIYAKQKAVVLNSQLRSCHCNTDLLSKRIFFTVLQRACVINWCLRQHNGGVVSKIAECKNTFYYKSTLKKFQFVYILVI
jgi:hypothetical protein